MRDLAYTPATAAILAVLSSVARRLKYYQESTHTYIIICDYLSAAKTATFFSAVGRTAVINAVIYSCAEKENPKAEHTATRRELARVLNED